MSAMLRYALPVLAAAGAASAQCSASATLTIQNAGDASALAECTTFTGSIAVATGTTDAINLASVKSITGDLSIASNNAITSVGADSLTNIGGTFTVSNCQILSSLSMPQLSSVGNIDFQGLPNLNTLGFTSNIAKTGSLNIQNTFLSTLDGINLQQVNSIYIANNRLLQDISFQVSNISKSLILESNGDRLTASFPNLMSAQNLTFRNVPTLSIPSLHNVSGSLGFYENSITSLTAPNLTTVGGTLAINTNTQLTNVTMDSLKSITGGLQVQNNTLLTSIVFPALESVGGATDMYGNLTHVSLPALKDNRGAFNIQSTGDLTTDCATFKAETGANNVIKGKYQCIGKVSNPGGAGTTPSSTESGTKKSDATLGYSPANTLIAVMAVILGLW
ncbi:hypothetical protein E2P81_ATG07702 [Venturia nashicola]|uniref:GPI-anchored cell wall organization protein Ecm33 n=1 Tax=Venturia nashicola TaxID=86259 RepID=A0A4Z1P496_9PEZI|nr:hypothetical protein E6O75_ATG07868 [Venturia nashicola]TLD22509.1 hypothetical protein E2P81_ATG07702 [Venturia nashicola]